MKRYPIFFSFDNRFVTPAAVTFESLLTNAGQDVSSLCSMKTCRSKANVYSPNS